MSLQSDDRNLNKGASGPPIMEAQSESHMSDEEKAAHPEPANPKPNAWSDFPDGGARAWAVAGGCSAVLFATFGMANAFG